MAACVGNDGRLASNRGGAIIMAGYRAKHFCLQTFYLEIGV